MQQVTILGSTGSIGKSTLEVLALHPEQYSIFALTAHHNVDGLLQQCLQYRPQYAVIAKPEDAQYLQKQLSQQAVSTEVLLGPQALVDVAEDAATDIVVAAIVGAAGLRPTLAAVSANKRVLLANKEALVMSGQVFIDALKESTAELLPVDSEHNALLQCAPPGFRPGRDIPEGVEGLILTASGGPFRDTPLDQLSHITPEQAVAHPNWDMGAKISVDSATMLNKGLEVVEAHWLFSLPLNNIEVTIHPQSIVHSFVRYRDGSLLAQMGLPDMRTPIAACLAWPERIVSGVEQLDVMKMGDLQFRAVEYSRYPCLKLVYQAMERAGTAMTVLNAANEVAVAAFLERKIGFLHIAQVIDHALQSVDIAAGDTLENVFESDRIASHISGQFVRELSARVPEKAKV